MGRVVDLRCKTYSTKNIEELYTGDADFDFYYKKINGQLAYTNYKFKDHEIFVDLRKKIPIAMVRAETNKGFQDSFFKLDNGEWVSFGQSFRQFQVI